MGCYFLALTAFWTLTYFVRMLAADETLFRDLGLAALPDVTKINISQDEYTRMMNAYLEMRQNSIDANSIPQLASYHMVNSPSQGRFRFPIKRSDRALDSAVLRILAPPHDGPVRVQVYQVVGARRRHLLDERTLYLDKYQTKWCEFDVTQAVRSWFEGTRNLGLELACDECESPLHPLESAISALVLPQRRRRRRSAPSHRRTDCRESRRSGKRRCCRHNMMVRFSDLRFPEMRYIVQPKTYEAGFCQGQCPPNYNHATNHSRIQSLIHQMDRKNAKLLNRRAVPKTCCAPSKLEPLEILRVNPMDVTKLIVEKWDNMQVIECACS